jgi:DNA-binding response OmpR family regulator
MSQRAQNCLITQAVAPERGAILVSGETVTSGNSPPEADSAQNDKSLTSILLVEDDALVRMSIADELRDQGYRVVEGSSAEEGRRFMLADEPISLIVTDVNLPGVSGLDFATWVRREFPDVHLVLMSGRHEHGDEASSLGTFLPKPFALETLANVIGKCLARL